MTIGRILVGLAVAAIMAVWILVPTAIYRSGSAALPAFTRLVTPGPLSASHAFVEASCESCHAPHRGVAASRCIACHADNAALLARQPTVFHATIGDCRGCHVEHFGRDRQPTAMQHDVLNAVASRQAGQAERATRSALDCASCHGTKDRHVGMLGRDCGACHELTQWTIAAFRHPSPRSTDCAQCHQPPPSHYMGHFHMVSRMIAGQVHAQVDQCHLCHQTTAWNDIKGVGWYKHH